MATFKTVEGVRLLKVGTWDASTGKASVTEQDLIDIVEAFESGELDIPVIKIGHLDKRFADPDEDGEPAYGQVNNLRVEDKGKTLVGDYVNVPEDLADKLASAYPHRSVEFYRGVELRDENDKVVAEFPVVLTAVALLGATPPAVTGLGTVHAEFSAKGSTGAVAFSLAQFALPGGLTGNALRTVLDDALRAWVKDASNEDAAPDWGWDVWVMDYDDTQIWYRVDGVTYQRGYTITDGLATLATDATPVIEERIFKPTGAPAAAPAPGASADTAPVPPATNAATESTTDSTTPDAKDTTTVDILAELRTLFGLPDDADEQAVLDAATAAKDAAEAEPAAASGGTAASSAPTDSVTVSAVAFSGLQAKVQDLETRNGALEAAATAKRRDEIVATALSEGRLTVTEVQPWRDELDAAEESTVRLLAARTPIFNTVELGHATVASAAGTAHAEALLAEEDRAFGIG